MDPFFVKRLIKLQKNIKDYRYIYVNKCEFTESFLNLKKLNMLLFNNEKLTQVCFNLSKFIHKLIFLQL